MSEAVIERHGRSLRQLIRYALIGLTTNSCGYSLYLLFTWLGGPPKIVLSVLYVTAATIGFLANRKLTFQHSGSVLHAGLRYAIAHLGGYLINLAMQWILVDHLGYPHYWVQAAAVFVVAAYLFLAFKYFVFRQR